MPPCHCQVAQCSGADVSLPTFKSHQRRDREQRFNDASDLARAASQRQDDIVSHYLARAPASERQQYTTRNSDDAMAQTRPRSDMYQHFVNERLIQLRDIENAANALIVEVEKELAVLQPPLARSDSFPLTSSTASIRKILDELASITSRSPSVQVAKASIMDRLTTLVAKQKDIKKRWIKARDELQEPHKDPVKPRLERSYNTETYNAPILPKVDPIIQASIFTMVVLQVMLHLSRRGCHFLLAMLRYIIQLSLQRNNPRLSVLDRKLLSDFPKDPDSAVKQFLLEGAETIYAVCPKATCHKLYSPTFLGTSPVPTYPKYCKVCGSESGDRSATRMTRPRLFGNVEVEVPIKQFVTFSFKEFVASLTSRPGMEDYMDGASKSQIEIGLQEMHDVFDGEFLRTFTGPDGKPFRSTSGPEGRYCFSLGLDFFNPYMNKQAGKKVSLGVVSIACLNLPIGIRHKPENMFLAGVIPGPNEPPLTATNNYIAPVVEEFLEFWQLGVWFSQTANFPHRRLIICALILVVCDLPAARKISGFASYSSEHFCNVCHCTLSQPGFGLQDLNYSAWVNRTNEEYRDAARQYHSCQTTESKEEQFRQHGIRWSELIRLPYFDMVKCVVVDPVHNHFLGLIKEHFTNVLGIRLQPFKESTVIELRFDQTPSNFTETNKKGVEKLKRWLQAPYTTTFGPTQARGLKKLMRINLPALEFVCEQLHCLPALPETAYTKQEYCESLLHWRGEQVELRETGATTSTPCGHVLQAEEMAKIWLDIEQLSTPTWMTSVPERLGQPEHGKLKADQWRVLGTTHLAISLIRLWGNPKANDRRSERCYEILHVTLSLISAVILASSHTITKASADAYLRHMINYLQGIQRLFPEYKLQPNHHMSLHIHRYLLLFGPSHSWWTFPFECLIGTLQRMPNNGKLEEIGSTISRAYTRSANLQTIFSKSGCPDVIQYSRQIFEEITNFQLRDNLKIIVRPELGDDIGRQSPIKGSERPLPADCLFAFLRANISAPGRGTLPSRTSINGLTFSTSSNHSGNACAMITTSSDVLPAQIVYIVQFLQPTGQSSTYLGIRRHKRAAIPSDPYAAFPILRARIWSASLDDIEIIQPSQVVCHFACLPFMLEEQELVVVLPLARTIVLL